MLRPNAIRNPRIISTLVAASVAQRPLTTLAQRTVDAIKAIASTGVFAPPMRRTRNGSRAE